MNLEAMAVLVGVLLLMWLTGRFVGRWAAIALGVPAVGFVGYVMVDSYYGVECGFPTFGPMICDAPAPAIYYLFVWFTGPLAIALLLVAMSFRYWRLSGKNSGV